MKPNNELFAVLDPMTAYKAQSIYDRGEHEITGVVLRNKTTGEKCIISSSAVRWVNREDWWTIMHPNPDVQIAGMKLVYAPNPKGEQQ